MVLEGVDLILEGEFVAVVAKTGKSTTEAYLQELTPLSGEIKLLRLCQAQ